MFSSKIGQLNPIERLKGFMLGVNNAVILLLVPLTAILIVLIRWHMVDNKAAFTIGQPAQISYYAIRDDLADDQEATKVLRSSAKERVIGAQVKSPLQTSIGFEDECNCLLNNPLEDTYLPEELRLILDSMQLDKREQVITVVRHVHDALLREDDLNIARKAVEPELHEVMTAAEKRAELIWKIINPLESDPVTANVIAQVVTVLDRIGPQIDVELTEQLRELATSNIPVIKRVYEKGSCIVKKDTVITQEIAQTLKRHGYPEGKFPFVSTLLSLITALFCAVWLRITVASHVSVEKIRSRFLYPYFLLIVSWFLQFGAVLLDVNGIGMFPTLAVIYLTLPNYTALGCAAAVVLSSAVIATGTDVNYIAVNILTGFAGIVAGAFFLRKNYTRLAVWKHECMLGLVVVCSAAFLQWGLLSFFSFQHLLKMLIICLLLSLCVIFVLPVLEMFFDVVSPLRLVELTQSTHPLIRRLMNEAPGTYQHSQMTGNLAEAAAEAIGLNPILLRAGAYFHDIGKLKQPRFFIENQNSGINEQDDFSPAMSAMIIISHVNEGLALAVKYRLPTQIKAFISEHHGTTCLTYFYKKAQQENLAVSETQFCYPGPKPQSKETGILMLADSIEAAARSNSASLKKIRDLIMLVDGVIASKIDGGQLDNVSFTFKDLTKIKKAMIQRLRAIYHSRDIKPLKSSANNSGKDKIDANEKQPTVAL